MTIVEYALCFNTMTMIYRVIGQSEGRSVLTHMVTFRDNQPVSSKL